MAQDDSRHDTHHDPTPVVGAATDVSPLGRGNTKPRHEQTADEDTDAVNWNRIAASDEFQGLIRAKLKFIVPATVFFILYYFALPVLVGYAPDLMKRRVFGVVNIAYLFALSQFFMAWIIAVLYVRAAARHDRVARNIVDSNEPGKGGNR